MDVKYKNGKLYISGNWNYMRRQYIALLLGLDEKYGFKREFMKTKRINFSSSGTNAELDDFFSVKEGEIYEHKQNWEKEYFIIEKDGIRFLSYSEAKKILSERGETND